MYLSYPGALLVPDGECLPRAHCPILSYRRVVRFEVVKCMSSELTSDGGGARNVIVVQSVHMIDVMSEVSTNVYLAVMSEVSSDVGYLAVPCVRCVGLRHWADSCEMHDRVMLFKSRERGRVNAKDYHVLLYVGYKGFFLASSSTASFSAASVRVVLPQGCCIAFDAAQCAG